MRSAAGAAAPFDDRARGPSLAAAYRKILAAHRQPARKRLTIRLTGREVAGLTRAAGGRPLSAAVQDIVSAYIREGRRPEPKEKSVVKTTFFLDPSLLLALQQMASEAGTTQAEIIHTALCEAFCDMGAIAD